MPFPAEGFGIRNENKMSKKSIRKIDILCGKGKTVQPNPSLNKKCQNDCETTIIFLKMID